MPIQNAAQRSPIGIIWSFMVGHVNQWQLNVPFITWGGGQNSLLEYIKKDKNEKISCLKYITYGTVRASRDTFPALQLNW